MVDDDQFVGWGVETHHISVVFLPIKTDHIREEKRLLGYNTVIVLINYNMQGGFILDVLDLTVNVISKHEHPHDKENRLVRS